MAPSGLVPHGLVHVIDDDEALRQSLAFLLGSAGFEARTWESATRFLAAVPGLAGHCVVTDVRMPEMTGLELLHRLKELGVSLPVIVVTGHGDVRMAVEAMKAGAADFLEKPFDDHALLTAVRSAVGAAVGRGRPGTPSGEVEARLRELTRRERDVLSGLVAGKPNKIIAFDLGISPRTVEVYRANVMAKMKAGSLSELVRLALAAGLA
jgi:two-component system response regulator FixJ